MPQSSIEVLTSKGWFPLDLNKRDGMFPPEIFSFENNLIEPSEIMDVKTTMPGYQGEIYKLYFLHPEVFDSLTQHSLQQKITAYCMGKAISDQMNKQLKQLNQEIKLLLTDANIQEAKSAQGSVEIKETVKKEYQEKELVAFLKQEGLNNLVKETVDEELFKNYLKTNKELAKKVDELYTKKTSTLKLQYSSVENPEIRDQLASDEEKTKSRQEVYRNLFSLAQSFDDQSISMAKAQEFTAKLEVLKNNHQNNKGEILQAVKTKTLEMIDVKDMEESIKEVEKEEKQERTRERELER